MACCDSTLGLLGIIAHAKVEIKAERRLFSNQETFDEADVLRFRPDLFKEISRQLLGADSKDRRVACLLTYMAIRVVARCVFKQPTLLTLPE